MGVAFGIFAVEIVLLTPTRGSNPWAKAVLTPKFSHTSLDRVGGNNPKAVVNVRYGPRHQPTASPTTRAARAV